MIEAQVDFDWSDMGSLFEAISESQFRPTHYSLDEDGARTPISWPAQWEAILGSSGCFLWGEQFEMEVRLSRDRLIRIFVLAEAHRAIESLMVRFAELAVLFGYACEEGERVHRNRIQRTMNYGTHEAWVGRNYEKYLSGLYWITLIPEAMMKRLGVELDSLKRVATEAVLYQNRTWLVRLYGDPTEWASKATAIDRWCAQTNGCFHKEKAENSLAQAANFIEASEAIEEWS
jgi:hypothetical protein